VYQRFFNRQLPVQIRGTKVKVEAKVNQQTSALQDTCANSKQTAKTTYNAATQPFFKIIFIFLDLSHHILF